MAVPDPTWSARMERRAAVVSAIRRFFGERGFMEVDTPVALMAPAPEPHIEAPRVEIDIGDRRQTRYLQTSPELPMKRLLARGLPRIFQIAPVFRDGDFSPTHRPEFRLLEWYRRDASWEALLDDCEQLVRAAAVAAGCGTRFTYQGRALDLAPPFRRLRVNDAFRRYAGFSILDCLDPAVLRAEVLQRGLPIAADDSWDDLFHRVFLSRVEPEMLRDPRPLFLTHYPAPLAALAQLSHDDARTAERVEMFVGGVELANGFGELCDPSAQRARFTRDRDRRLALGRHDYPFDEHFLAALAELGSAAGMALGLERLLMVLLNAGDIEDVAFIPWSKM